MSEILNNIDNLINEINQIKPITKTATTKIPNKLNPLYKPVPTTPPVTSPPQTQPPVTQSPAIVNQPYRRV
ncbi:MAG: hypothetical protein H7836_12440 [Magnetococcus sp. YQC-3]